MLPALGMLLSLVALVGVSAGAMAQWQPSVGAHGYRLYQGPGPGAYDTMMDVGGVTQAILTGLTVGDTYYFAVTAYNLAGESGYSNEVAYTVPASPPVDTLPPTVQWLAPPDGSTVPRKRVVVLMADAQDAGGVADVEFYVNGRMVCTDVAPPYACDWRVPAARSKRYALQAIATDQAGQVAISPLVTVTAQ